MTDERKNLSIVFFDICNYSQQADGTQIGWVTVLENAIKSSPQWKDDQPLAEGGDSFALGFDEIRVAVAFAIHIMICVKRDDSSLRIRMGIYTGEVTIRQSLNRVKNLYGRGIDFAARLASCCLPGQILVASHALEASGPVRFEIPGVTIHPAGKYRVKHGHEVNVYNIFMSGEGIGVQELPLKRRVDDSRLLIVVGDRREKQPKTVGDLFLETPSVDDLCHIFKFDWPDDVLLRGDKIMCWAQKAPMPNQLLERNLFVIGSPKVNIAALMVNSSSLFRFALHNPTDVDKIKSVQANFHDSPPGDDAFEAWVHKDPYQLLTHYPQGLSNLSFEDPLQPRMVFAREETRSFALVSFAQHPFRQNGERYVVFVAGIDLCATLTVTREFFNLDFSKHPFGGIISVRKPYNRVKPWYEHPHCGELGKENDGWATPEYTSEQLMSSLDTDRRLVIENLIGMNRNMRSIQDLIRKNK